MKPQRLLFFFLFSGLLIATVFAQEIRRAIPVYAAPDEVAQLLAGLPVIKGSPLLGLQLSKDYSAHNQSMKEAWKDYREQRYDPMRQWADREARLRIPTPAVVRYLFGGPDLLSVMAAFPEAPVYILCGKEPVGKIIPPETLWPEQLQMGLAGLREATSTFLHFGYFITIEMRAQMARGPFQGVLPLLLTFLALSDHQILAVDMISFGGSPGVRIRFVERSGGNEQILFYAQTDLSNDASRSFLKWLGSFGPGAAYLKAASYLLHEDDFSHAREFLLSNSTAILQDDSGIPLRFFELNNWTLYFFGDYKSPIELFRKYYQPDLYAAYTASPLRGPMPFGTGYQLNSGESGGANLLLAVRRTFAPRALPVH